MHSQIQNHTTNKNCLICVIYTFGFEIWDNEGNFETCGTQKKSKIHVNTTKKLLQKN